MPIAGVIDPSHKANQTSNTPPKWMPVEVMLEEAYHGGPKWSAWSYELLKAALDEVEDRGDSISTTALTSPCPRSAVLERKEDYVVDVGRLWRAFRGTMVHYVMEAAARPNSIAEVRFFAPFGTDDVLSCKPDLVTESGEIWDYKNTAKNPVYNYPYTSHKEQVQINRWVLNHATKWEKDGKVFPIPFDVRTTQYRHLVIQYMDIDGPKVLECEKSIQVPNKSGQGTHSQRVPDVWSDKQVMELVQPRFMALRAALDAYPEWPDGIESVWGGEPGWGCPGYPYCPLKGMCLASRYPKGLIW